MKADFSRDSFDATRHFLRVLMQQGRVQLDADWNEQVAILLHYLQNLAADLIGPHGGPEHNLGFAIIADENTLSEEDKARLRELKILPLSKGDFLIGKGHYYVEGRLCANDDFVPFSKQPDYPLPQGKDLPSGTHLVYLDVWERLVTWLQEPMIHEAALGSVDTTARSKLNWHVKIEPGKTKADVETKWKELVNNWQSPNRGLLRAKGKEASKKNVDPCVISPEARYRGAENQLYRVEIHQGSEAGTATFKWSRDNGSTIFPIRKLEGDTAIVEHLGLDDRHALRSDDWVEIVDDDLATHSASGPLFQIAEIDLVEKTVKLKMPAGKEAPTYAWDSPKHPMLRRWESDEAKIIEKEENVDHWHDLEDGIRIQFEPLPPLPDGGPQYHKYRSGDYWLIPARVAAGDVIWPQETDEQGRLKRDKQGNTFPQALPPHGIEHYYAPLWVIKVEASGNINVAPANSGDCRCAFMPHCAPATGASMLRPMAASAPKPEPEPEPKQTKPKNRTRTRSGALPDS